MCLFLIHVAKSGRSVVKGPPIGVKGTQSGSQRVDVSGEDCGTFDTDFCSESVAYRHDVVDYFLGHLHSRQMSQMEADSSTEDL